MASTCKGVLASHRAGGGVIPELIQVLQSLVVLGFAPLYAGVLTCAEGVVASKRGAL